MRANRHTIVQASAVIPARTVEAMKDDCVSSARAAMPAAKRMASVAAIAREAQRLTLELGVPQR